MVEAVAQKMLKAISEELDNNHLPTICGIYLMRC